MMKIILLCLFYVLVSFQKVSTVYIEEMKYGRKQIPYYVMYYVNKSGAKFQVIRVENRDYVYDFKYDFKYLNKSIDYICYTLYDQATGISFSIFFDRKNNRFFKSEKYDLHALGDKVVPSSVNFDSLNVLVETPKTLKNYKRYKICLSEIDLVPSQN